MRNVLKIVLFIALLSGCARERTPFEEGELGKFEITPEMREQAIEQLLENYIRQREMRDSHWKRD